MKIYPKLKCLKLHKILRKYKNNSNDKMFILEFRLRYLFQFFIQLIDFPSESLLHCESF